MADVDIKAAVAEAKQTEPAWQLRLVVDGQAYVTASPTAADVIGIRRVGEMSEPEAFDLLDRLFVEPRPPLREMHADGRLSDEELVAIFQAINLEVGERAAKNSRAVAAAISRAAGHTMVQSRTKTTSSK